MARLGFNIECIALLRETAGIMDADPVHAAFLAELGGADAVICPIREEFRPLSEKDIRILKATVKVRFDLRLSASDKLMGAALSIHPDGVTLVPKGKTDSTPNGGLDVIAHEEELDKNIQELHGQNIVVSCFVDPLLQQIKAAAGLGADYVELNAGGIQAAQGRAGRDEFLETLRDSSLAASKLNLGVSIGGNIQYRDVSVIAGIERVEELRIGRAVAGRALLIGMEQAVRDMAAMLH